MKKKKHLAHAATLLPLAIGLAMNGLGPANKPTVPAPAARTAHAGAAAAPGALTPVCLPFEGNRIPEIDDHCGMLGGSSDPAKQAESQAKNNFCAAEGPSQPVTYDELLALQKKAADQGLKSPVDRSALAALGEGRYVQFIALIRDAHYSDVGQGEAVNCNLPGTLTNDIHIVLVQHAGDDECLSTTAEMVPHFRPTNWTPENLNAVKQHPVRIHGPLFYDGSHSPCTATSRPNPKRASLWEIHPVYALDVCKMTDIAQCRNTTSEADWVSLDNWVAQHPT